MIDRLLPYFYICAGFAVAACAYSGWVQSTSAAPIAAETCVGGVSYLTLPGGVTVRYGRDGLPVSCMPAQ